jgi:hypothetical protein
VRLSSCSASRAPSTGGSTRYRGRRSRLRHARYSKRSCRNTPWLSSSARGPLESRVSQASTRAGRSAISVRCLALRAAVLRRALRQLRVPLECFGYAQVFSHKNTLRTGWHASLRIRSTPCGTTLAGRESDPQCGQRSRFQALPRRRPNPSIERTSNGGAHWCASPSSVAPLAAAHVKR